MRSTSLAAAIAATMPLITGAAPRPAVAQESPSTSTLSASGAAPYRVAVEGVDFMIVVEGKGKTAAMAVSPCDHAVDSVRAALARFGNAIASSEILAQGVTPFTPTYGQPAGEDRYVARSIFRVRLADPRQLVPVTAAAFDAGGSRTLGFRFTSRGAEAARQAALDTAAAVAVRRGERMARALGGRLGSVRTIDSSDSDPNAVYANYPTDQDRSSQLFPEISGTINVMITWTYLPPN